MNIDCREEAWFGGMLGNLDSPLSKHEKLKADILFTLKNIFCLIGIFLDEKLQKLQLILASRLSNLSF